MPRAKRLDTRTRRKQIAMAAVEVIAEYGVSGLSIERIARIVGVVPSGVYRHYSDKEEVLSAVVDGIRDIINDNLEASERDGTDALDALRLVHGRHVRFLKESGGFPRLMFSEEAFDRGGPRARQMRSVMKGFLARLAGLIRRGKNEGSIRSDVEPDAAALMFVGTLAPAAVLVGRLAMPHREATKRLDSMWRLYEAALAAGPRAGGAPQRRQPRKQKGRPR